MAVEPEGNVVTDDGNPYRDRYCWVFTMENAKINRQERLGHTTFTTSMDSYSQVTPTMQRAAVDRFTAAVNGTG